MLTPRHMEILRAALQFFDEEMSPHGIEGILTYVERHSEGPVTPQQIKHLRDMLVNCQLLYAGFDRRALKLTSHTMIERRDQITAFPGDYEIATLLLFPADL